MSAPVLRPARAHGAFTAVDIGAMALGACSSSSSSKPQTTSSSVDTPSTATHPNAADKVHLAFTGDITGNLTPEADAPITCGQTGPQNAAIRGAVGGHTASRSSLRSPSGRRDFRHQQTPPLPTFATVWQPNPTIPQAHFKARARGRSRSGTTDQAPSIS